MENLKLPVALVAAMAIQLAAGVWWVSQQATTIGDLKKTMSELGSKMAIEDNIHLKRDVLSNTEQLEELQEDVSNFTQVLTRQLQLMGRISTIEAKIEYMNQ
jgi:hypothetical protein